MAHSSTHMPNRLAESASSLTLDSKQLCVISTKTNAHCHMMMTLCTLHIQIQSVCVCVCVCSLVTMLNTNMHTVQTHIYLHNFHTLFLCTYMYTLKESTACTVHVYYRTGF